MRRSLIPLVSLVSLVSLVMLAASAVLAGPQPVHQPPTKDPGNRAGTPARDGDGRLDAEDPRQDEDRLSIEGLFRRYEAALETLDVAEYMKVWPSASEKQIRRNFKDIRRQELELYDLDIEVSGVRATATCQFKAMIVDTRGNEHRFPEIKVTVDLGRADGGWVMEAMREGTQ